MPATAETSKYYVILVLYQQSVVRVKIYRTYTAQLDRVIRLFKKAISIYIGFRRKTTLAAGMKRDDGSDNSPLVEAIIKNVFPDDLVGI